MDSMNTAMARFGWGAGMRMRRERTNRDED
jgi:hypothetical protein